MTEIDPSLILKDGDVIYFRGVKYQRVEKPKPDTLYDIIADWWDEIFTNGNPSGQNIESLIDTIESEWLPKEHDTNSYKWNECIRMIRGKLR